jgi:hypothetical protein
VAGPRLPHRLDRLFERRERGSQLPLHFASHSVLVRRIGLLLPLPTPLPFGFLANLLGLLAGFVHDAGGMSPRVLQLAMHVVRGVDERSLPARTRRSGGDCFGGFDNADHDVLCGRGEAAVGG